MRLISVIRAIKHPPKVLSRGKKFQICITVTDCSVKDNRTQLKEMETESAVRRPLVDRKQETVAEVA